MSRNGHGQPTAVWSPTPGADASSRAGAEDRRRSGTKRLIWAGGAVVVGVTLVDAGSGALSIVEGREGGLRLLRGFLRPDLSMDLLGQIGSALLETIRISVTGTLVAAVIAAPTAVVLARSTHAPRWLRSSARVLAAVLRGVPDLVWALVFVATVGPGMTAGWLALAMHGGGLLAKLWAEQLEAVDPAPVEAVALTGSGRAATTLLGVLPQARARLASVLLYQFECNIRTSTVLGFVGGGGIGQALAISLRLFRYDELTTLVGAVLGLVCVVDASSRRLRRALGAHA